MEQLCSNPNTSPAQAGGVTYDPQRVKRVVQIFETILRRPDRPFDPCHLVEYETDLIRRNFGEVAADGYSHRRIEIPKAWKRDGHQLDAAASGGPGLPLEVFSAGLVLAMLTGGFSDTEIYLSAPAKAARAILRAAATLVDLSPMLRRVLFVSLERKTILHRRRPLLTPGWQDRWCCKLIFAENIAPDFYCVISTRHRNA